MTEMIFEKKIDNLVIDEIYDFKTKPSDDNLLFGKDFTDRMLLREYKNGKCRT